MPCGNEASYEALEMRKQASHICQLEEGIDMLASYVCALMTAITTTPLEMDILKQIERKLGKLNVPIHEWYMKHCEVDRNRICGVLDRIIRDPNYSLEKLRAIEKIIDDEDR